MINAFLFDSLCTLVMLLVRFCSSSCAWHNCWLSFQSLVVPDTPSVSPSKSAKVGKKYGLGKHTSKAKERKNKDRLMVSCRVVASSRSCVAVERPYVDNCTLRVAKSFL